jgi:hypothetical protein
MLMMDVEQPTPSAANAAFRLGRRSMNWFGLLLLPIALLVYLIAMPFFALFWLIEWFLPLSAAEGDLMPGERPLPALNARTEDSPSR